MKNSLLVLFLLMPFLTHAAIPIKSTQNSDHNIVIEQVQNKIVMPAHLKMEANAIRNNRVDKEKKGNGFGIASLSCSIAGLIYPVLGVLGIVFGAIGMGKNRSLRGLAIAGFVLGILELIISVLALIIILAFI